jgi:hypothetical protein
MDHPPNAASQPGRYITKMPGLLIRDATSRRSRYLRDGQGKRLVPLSQFNTRSGRDLACLATLSQTESMQDAPEVCTFSSSHSRPGLHRKNSSRSNLSFASHWHQIGEARAWGAFPTLERIHCAPILSDRDLLPTVRHRRRAPNVPFSSCLLDSEEQPYVYQPPHVVDSLLRTMSIWRGNTSREPCAISVLNCHDSVTHEEDTAAECQKMFAKRRLSFDYSPEILSVIETPAKLDCGRIWVNETITLYVTSLPVRQGSEVGTRAPAQTFDEILRRIECKPGALQAY